MKQPFVIILLIFLRVGFLHAQFGLQNDLSKSEAGSFDVKSFDLDNDGDLDIVSAAFWGDKFSWYENLGNGNFSEQHIISYTSDGAQSIYAADLDQDGYLDVITASGNKIEWYKNIGGFQFDLQPIISTDLIYARSVHAEDLDGDGDIDILSASSIDNKIAWYENNGGGVFSSQQIISTNANLAWSVYTADIDGDGDQDVLSASRGDNKIAWYENLGGSFGAQQVITTNALEADAVFSEDLDNDGDLDVLSASRGDDKIAWYINDGSGSFSGEQILSTFADVATDVFAIDMDNDGDIDVLSASRGDNKIAWYENLGGGSFSSQQFISFTARGAQFVRAADLDNDGDVDVFAACELGDKVEWYENTGGNVYASGQQLTTSANGARDAKIADLDGDGDLDILSASQDDGKVAWYENLGGGVFSAQQIITIASSAESVYAADLDQDGLTDVAFVSLSDNKIAWFKNLGSSNFGPEQVVSTNMVYPHSIFATDLNNDGNIDLLSASAGDSKVAWYENLGGGNFGAQQVITSNALGANSVFAADLNGDGKTDVLSASWFDDKIAWYENQGGGSFGAEQIVSLTADYATDVHASDLDGDGMLDIISCSRDDNKIAWYKNLGAGTFGPEQVVVNDAQYVYSTISEDVDADGDNDLISAGNGQIRWYENDGVGSFISDYLISPNVYNGQSVYMGDLDGDGDPDLLSASWYDDKIAWYENFYESPYKISGLIYYDINQNQIYDGVDYGLSSLSATLSPNSLASYASVYGNYFFGLDTGNYFVQYNAPDSLWALTTASSSYTVQLTGANPVMDSADFGFYPDTLITIMSSSIVGGVHRCNDTINYWISIKNLGTTNPRGIVHLKLADSVHYISSAVPPDSIIDQNIYWHYDSLSFYATEYFHLAVHMPDFQYMGDTLKSYVHVHETDAAGSIVYTSSDSLKQVLLCAYDPNDKMVTPTGLGPEGYIHGNQVLEYLIRFQNTGNDTARTVMVRDQLDSGLDWSTFEPISSSHSMQVSLTQGGELVFLFENINLPDSTTDLLGSQGFVKFRIKPTPGQLPGTQFFNTGHIYFDYNPAVITNTVLNTIYNCSSVQINMNQTTVCKGEFITGSGPLEEYNSYSWEIPTIYSNTGNSFAWASDTVGTFDLTINVSNEICSVDSIYNITVLPPVPITYSTIKICPTDSALIYGNFQNIAGQYMDTLISIQGCDSILSTTLIHYDVADLNQTFTICQGDSLWIYDSYESSAGIYIDTTQNSFGCDSVTTTTLQVNPIQVQSSNESICSGDSLLIFGNYQSLQGTYFDTLQTYSGCDSILMVTLQVNGVSDLSINQVDSSLIANLNGAVYQWVDCDQGLSEITGATNQIFNITSNGSYAVEITEGLCTDTSECFLVGNLGQQILEPSFVSIQPNPNEGSFTVVAQPSYSHSIILVVNAFGEIITSKKHANKVTQFDLDVTPGIYYVWFEQHIFKLVIL